MNAAPATNVAPATNAFDAAMNPSERPQSADFFGEVVTVDPWFAILEKGAGKRPFDASRDDANRRVTIIKLSIECRKKDGSLFTIDQETAEFELAWSKITLGSLKRLGIHLRDLRGELVHARRVPTGETYIKRDTGETKTKSGLEIVAVYQSYDEMDAAADVFFKQPRANNSTASSGNAQWAGGIEVVDLPSPRTHPMPTSLPAMDPMQKFALDSLPRLIEQAEGDQARLRDALKSTGFDKWYPMTHPHLVALLNGTIDEFSIAA